MKKASRLIKRYIALILVLLFSIESFAAVVGDNDGAAFITKAEFDSMKNDFQSQLDRYNSSLDNKIDGAIASYLAGVGVTRQRELDPAISNYYQCKFYRDFKIYGRTWTLTTSNSKSISEEGWYELHNPATAVGPRGTMMYLTLSNGRANQSYVLGYSNMVDRCVNVGITRTDFSQSNALPIERFYRKTDNGLDYYVRRMLPGTDATGGSPEVNGVFSYTGTFPNSRSRYWYLASDQSGENKCNITFTNDPANFVTATFAGWSGYNVSGLSEYNFTCKTKFSDITSGLNTLNTHAYIWGDSLSSSTILGFNYAPDVCSITQNWTATVPKNATYASYIDYGMFAPTDNEIRCYTENQNGLADYSDVTEYGELQVPTSQGSLSFPFNPDWSSWTQGISGPYMSAGQTAYINMPIAPKYKIKNLGHGRFKAPDGSYLNFCDGLMLLTKLDTNGNLNINLDITLKKIKDNADINAKGKLTLLYTKNSADTKKYVQGTLKNTTDNVTLAEDETLQNIEIDGNKSYNIRIDNYDIKDGTDIYLSLVPDSQDNYFGITQDTLKVKLETNS